VLVVSTTRAGDRAGKIGGVIFAYTAVAIVAPTLGGTLITGAGYAVVFAFAAFVLIANVALVGRLHIGRDPVDLAFDLPRLGARTSLALFSEGGFEGVLFGVVPLLAYGFAQDELAIGGVFSLFALAGGTVTVVLGIASDRLRHRRPFLVAGAAATAASTLLVVAATSLPALALGNSLVSLTSPIAPLFLLTIAVERIPSRPADAIITREVLLNGGRTVSLAAFLALLVLGVSASHGFALAGVCVAAVAVVQAWKSQPREQRALRSAD
jgi:MFS family permease